MHIDIMFQSSSLRGAQRTRRVSNGEGCTHQKCILVLAHRFLVSVVFFSGRAAISCFGCLLYGACSARGASAMTRVARHMHLCLLTCSSLGSAYMCVMHVRCVVYVACARVCVCHACELWEQSCACLWFFKGVFHDVCALYTQKRMKSMKSNESPCEIRC